MAVDNLSRSAESGFAWERAASRARRCALVRTVQALFREQLLDASQLIRDGTCAWLPLWRQQAMLRFDGLSLGRSGACRLEGGIGLYTSGQAPRLIGGPSALLAAIAPSIGAGAEALARLQLELDNSIDNDTLCLSYRDDWTRALRPQAAPFGSFYGWLRQAPGNPALLLEQWGTIGHPWHPCHKTKLGLASDDVVALSPEFRASVDLPVLALREREAHVESAQGGADYRRWFAERFPSAWDAWRDALAAGGEDAARWLPLPAHPLQAERVLPQDFADAFERGVLRALPGVRITASPTMSFRTVVPDGQAGLPHVKLPVALRLTSVQRTVSPKSAVMGPRLTALLRRILADEAGFDGTLDILGEPIGVHYRLPEADDDRARHVSVLFRDNPMAHRRDGLFPYVVGALFADSPLDGRPLVDELIRLSGRAPMAFYGDYLRVALAAVLGPYLLYGVAFEAHQQNSVMLFDVDGRPRRLLVRDFGDLRVHRPTLRLQGHDLQPHRAGHSAFDDAAPVRDKLLHAVFQCHFAELGLLIAAGHGLDEAQAWQVFAHEAVQAFERWRPRAPGDRWAAERHALLDADWPAKALLRMRVSDQAGDVLTHMPNPLRPR